MMGEIMERADRALRSEGGGEILKAQPLRPCFGQEEHDRKVWQVRVWLKLEQRETTYTLVERL